MLYPRQCKEQKKIPPVFETEGISRLKKQQARSSKMERACCGDGGLIPTQAAIWVQSFGARLYCAQWGQHSRTTRKSVVDDG